VTAGKTTCFHQIDSNTIAIVGTASNKSTDQAFNTSPYVLVIAQDSPDAFLSLAPLASRIVGLQQVQFPGALDRVPTGGDVQFPINSP
jgi:hypothetical protein